MDCTDIVIGMANGGLSRIGDFYTRDRSSPLSDEQYGGADDLLAAYAIEAEGYTFMMFRKPLQGIST